MSYTIQQIHNFIFLLANKQQNAFFSHEDVDGFLDFYQMSILDKMTGRPEANRGNVNPVSSISQKQWDNDALNPFKKKVTFLNADSPLGLLTLPSDYFRFKSLYFQTYNNISQDIKPKGVQILGDDLIPKRLGSFLLPVNKNPFGEWIASVDSSGNPVYQIQLYPKQASAGYYTYLSRPLVPKFNYTLNGRQVVFVPTGSQNLLWNDAVQTRIVIATLQALGLNATDQQLIQLSQVKQSEGVLS